MPRLIRQVQVLQLQGNIPFVCATVLRGTYVGNVLFRAMPDIKFEYLRFQAQFRSLGYQSDILA